jgi:hypothetical protein
VSATAPDAMNAPPQSKGLPEQRRSEHDPARTEEEHEADCARARHEEDGNPQKH